MRWPVDEDGDEPVGVGEVGPGAGARNTELGVGGEAEPTALNVSQPPFLELGVACCEEPFELLGPGERHGGDLDGRAGEGLEDFLDRVAVEAEVVGLVAIAHQAVVTGGLAVLLSAWGAADVLAA